MRSFGPFVTLCLLAVAPLSALGAPIPVPTDLSKETPDTLSKLKISQLMDLLNPVTKDMETLVHSMATQAKEYEAAHPAAASPSPSASANATVAAVAAATSATSASVASATSTAPAVAAAAAAAPSPATPEGGDPANPSPPATPVAAAAETEPKPDAAGGDPSTAAAAAAPLTPAEGAQEGAEAPAAAAPAEGGETLQRRDAAPPAPTPSKPAAPSTDVLENVKASDVLKLRQLIERASLIEKAVETAFINKGLNVEERPTMKTASGTAWGIVNGPIFGLLRSAQIVQGK